jgi:cardiolipin synthase C
MKRSIAALPALALCLALSLTLTACVHLEPRPELPIEAALPPGDNTALDHAIAGLEAAHPGQSAFRLVTAGTEAFVSRMQSARQAMRSIDVQTYIWHADLTGIYFAHELLAAADRGVKVRMLIDDMDARAKNDGIASLAAHPNIEVRLFNPFASRKGKLAFLSEGLRSFSRVNRRMHNKTWIVDNRIALAGGRNVGDEYFEASNEVNFTDLDFAMIGPVVRDASASFDKYWNSPSAYPMALLDPAAINEAALHRLRDALTEHVKKAESSDYSVALRQSDAIRRMISGDWPMEWAEHYQFVSDDPLKVTMSEQDARRTAVGSTLVPMIKATRSQVSILSPYFVPGREVTTALASMAMGGTRVGILTNSLAANDVAAVHGGYSRYRKSLLKGGVQLWEMKPMGVNQAESSLFGSSGASLHTKAFAVDGRTLFVGSYNLDPRSTWLNCEQGVLVENATLAKQLEANFAEHTEGPRAWRVTLDDNEMRWSDGTESFDSDPHASLGRRFQAWLTRVLHLDAQL